MKQFILIFFLLFPISAKSEQSSRLDSLITFLKTDNEDTTKVNHLNDLALEYKKRNPDTSFILLNDALILSEKINWEKGASNSMRNIGGYYMSIDNYPQALNFYLNSLKISEKLNDKPAIAKTSGSIGVVYKSQADYPKALDFYLKALKMDEELGNKKGITRHLGNIGIIYWQQGDYSKALEYYFKALKAAENNGNKNYIAALLGNIGLTYKEQADYPKALGNYFKALKMAEDIGDMTLISNTLSNIGGVYIIQAADPHLNPGERNRFFEKALDYYKRSLKIAEEQGDKNGIARQLGNLGLLHTKTGKFNDAEAELKKAIAIDSAIGAHDYLRQYEELISQLYDTTGRYKQALIHFKKAVILKDTIFSEESKKQLVRKEMNYQFEKKEMAAKADQEKKDAVAAEEKKKQKIIVLSLIAGSFFVMVFLIFVYRSLRITRKQKAVIEKQKDEVSLQKKIVEDQKAVVETQKELVEAHQKEIIDSIYYAKRIQQAMLPSPNYIAVEIQRLNAESFIFFQPKDIVSGDFYWFYAEDQVLYYITADCTGHGVPGGFMSMLGINLLNDIVIERKNTDPGTILNLLRREIIRALKTDGGYTKDGMDAIFCKVDFSEKRLEYAAANNSFYIVRKEGEGRRKKEEGGTEKGEQGKRDSNLNLIELKAQKMPVGYQENAGEFQTQIIQLQKGDTIYSFTDGYADQFGGPKGKKFLYKRFEEILLSNSASSLEDQRMILEKAFTVWKGELEQIDDVCVIGVKII